MTSFLIFELATGRGQQVSVAPTKGAALSGFGDGFDAIEVAGHVSDATHYVDRATRSVREFPPQPGPWARFDWGTLAWRDVRTDADLASEARTRRDATLRSSDWTQLADAPLDGARRAAWAAYRGALRNVPQQAGFPREIDWPAAPT